MKTILNHLNSIFREIAAITRDNNGRTYKKGKETWVTTAEKNKGGVAMANKFHYYNSNDEQTYA